MSKPHVPIAGRDPIDKCIDFWANCLIDCLCCCCCPCLNKPVVTDAEAAQAQNGEGEEEEREKKKKKSKTEKAVDLLDVAVMVL